jgi:hypothetical protein
MDRARVDDQVAEAPESGGHMRLEGLGRMRPAEWMMQRGGWREVAQRRDGKVIEGSDIGWRGGVSRGVTHVPCALVVSLSFRRSLVCPFIPHHHVGDCGHSPGRCPTLAPTRE